MLWMGHRKWCARIIFLWLFVVAGVGVAAGVNLTPSCKPFNQERERERESKIKEFTAHENAADTDQIHFFCLTYKLFLREREKR